MALLKIDCRKITENFLKLRAMCKTRDIDLVPVTKICLSHPDIVGPLLANGASIIADSRLYNLNRLPESTKKMLLKLRYSDVEKLNGNCDIIYTSDYSILEKLNREKPDNSVQVILAIELGDLREGILVDQLEDFIKKVERLTKINIVGIGGNLGCLSGKLPDNLVMEKIHASITAVKHITGLPVPTVSLGGTAVQRALINDQIIPEVNQIRMGEAIFFGYNLTLHERIESLHHDAFVVSGEVLEVQEKTVEDLGSYAYNAFGKAANMGMRGRRKRAVLDFGELGAPAAGLIAFDNGIGIVGSTHDYCIVDLTESPNRYTTGDTLDFHCNYNTAAVSFISPYMEKEILR